MIKLCTDPSCDEEAGLTIQRQIDPEGVPYCHPHGAQRQHALNQALENFRVVVIPPAAPPTPLELAEARISELEELLRVIEASGGGDVDSRQSLAKAANDQLATTLHTLETQSRALSSARNELADREQSMQTMRREMDRMRAELERTRAELATAKTAPAPAAPITPPPPTQPDPK